MSAYYNEIDTYAAEWLRNLIKAGLIADGEVDERSIVDVQADDLRGFAQCHFFAGIGGWSYALRLAGWPDSRPVWTGSCPCQPFSSSGKKLAQTDPRDLWPAWFKLIEKQKPARVFGEQVAAAITYGWLDRLRYDLEESGYAIGVANLPACSVGSPQVRPRLFFVADSLSRNEELGRDVSGSWREQAKTSRHGTWPKFSEPPVLDRTHGVSQNMGVLRGMGNAIVPQVAAEFISAFMECATE
jgi:DNA (cytosine-5)-methyltransferase 1